MKFTFPKIKEITTAIGKTSILNQVYKIKEEVFEFQNSKGKERDLECLDILHSSETLVRMHFEGREDEIDGLIKWVVEKNRDRGYY